MAIDVEAAAANPKQVSVDGQSVEEHSLKDLIAAAEHVAEQEAVTRRTLPIRLMKTRFGGPVVTDD